MDSPCGSQGDYRKEQDMSHTKKGDKTRQVVRLGLDIAKSSFLEEKLQTIEAIVDKMSRSKR